MGDQQRREFHEAHLDVDVWERPTALFAAYSLALASRAICSIFGYDEPDQLEAMLERIEAIQRTDESSST